MDAKFYQSLLDDIKTRIRISQVKAALSVNAEMIALYFDIGKLINQLQHAQGWGATVTSRLANDIKNELPEIKGFSERNLFFMVQFYKEYNENLIVKQAVSQLAKTTETNIEFVKRTVSQIPWGHNTKIYVISRNWVIWKDKQ